VTDVTHNGHDTQQASTCMSQLALDSHKVKIHYYYFIAQC